MRFQEEQCLLPTLLYKKKNDNYIEMRYLLVSILNFMYMLYTVISIKLC